MSARNAVALDALVALVAAGWPLAAADVLVNSLLRLSEWNGRISTAAANSGAR